MIMVPLCKKSVSPVVMSGDVSDKPADGDTLSPPFSGSLVNLHLISNPTHRVNGCIYLCFPLNKLTPSFFVFRESAGKRV